MGRLETNDLGKSVCDYRHLTMCYMFHKALDDSSLPDEKRTRFLCVVMGKPNRPLPTQRDYGNEFELDRTGVWTPDRTTRIWWNAECGYVLIKLYGLKIEQVWRMGLGAGG